MSDIEFYSQAGPSHQRRASEIIDVDALPDEIAAGPSSSTRRSQSVSLSNSPPVHGRPPVRRQRVVYVIDSDDDEALPRPLSGASRRRLFSPPAPAAQHHPIPPVPALPRRYSRHPSHANQPPVIIPNHAPFAFEVQLDQRPPSPQPPVLPPRGAPRSHHQPALGLGGALLALNRRETENRQRAQEAQQGRQFRPFGVIADTIMHYFGARPEPPPGHVPYLDFADFMEADWGDDPWDGEWLPEGHRHNGNFGFPKTAPKPPAWIPSYTHPGEPEPGFTFHFESKPAKTPPATVLVIHDDGHVTESANSPPAPEQQPTLVCARCLDPLVMSGQGGPELSGEEAKKLRVWALRCGHMLDGKCIGELMRPEYIIQDKTVPEIAGKTLKRSYSSGKSRIVAVPADRKGKRKAVERDPSMGDLGLDLLMTDDTSMRSRLRPRGNRSLASVAMNDVSMASVASTPAQPVPPATRSTRPVRPLPRRGTTGASSSVQMETSNANLSKPKAKGKGRARKPVVEARHEWFCPVAGCCKEHGSVRMRGEEEWKMDDAIGAIALYV